MMAYNEGDVVLEALRSLTAWGIKSLAVVDGHSDDGTWEKLLAASRGHYYPDIDIDLFLEREPRVTDWKEQKREKAYALARKIGSFDWIMNIDADMMFDTSPLEACYIAETTGAKCIFPLIPQFWVTMDDLKNGGAQVVDESIPVQDRLKWYSWGWHENRFWKESPDLHYFDETRYGSHLDPMSEYGYVDWPAMQSAALCRHNLPILKHYSIRGLMQGFAKQLDRLKRGRSHFGKMAEAWIIDEEFCGLAKQIEPGVWDTTYTHQRLYDWFARANECANEIAAAVNLGESTY